MSNNILRRRHMILYGIQLAIWLVSVALVGFYIFIANSPFWGNVLITGVSAQFAVVILMAILTRKPNWSWVIYDTILLALICLLYSGINMRGEEGFMYAILFIFLVM